MFTDGFKLILSRNQNVSFSKPYALTNTAFCALFLDLKNAPLPVRVSLNILLGKKYEGVGEGVKCLFTVGTFI